MKFSLTFFLLFATTFSSFSQIKTFLKLYQNTDIYSRSEHLYDNVLRERVSKNYTIQSFDRPSVGLSILTNDKWQYEIEFSYYWKIPPVDQNSWSSKSEDFNSSFISLHLETSRILYSSKNIYLSFGMGINGYKSESKSNPQNDQYFPITDYNKGVDLTIVPRIYYLLNDKITFEISVKLKTVNINEYKMKIHNPAVPEPQKTYENDAELTFFPLNYNIRLGIAYRLK